MLNVIMRRGIYSTLNFYVTEVLETATAIAYNFKHFDLLYHVTNSISVPM